MNIKLIKASAGSGKTYTLMKLLSKSISEGVRPDGLLATTFTVKAAAELQSRIRQELLNGSNPELASQVFDGLIGTVNGVCGQLLSEYAIESGLSPALDVLPEDNAKALFSAATHAIMGKYALEIEALAARLSLNPLKNNPHKSESNDWQTHVREIVNLARNNNITPSELMECAEKSCASLKEVFTCENDLSLEDIKNMLKPLKDFAAQGTATANTVKRINDFFKSPSWYQAASLGGCGYTVTKDPSFDIEKLHIIRDLFLGSRYLYEDMASMIRKVFACAGEAIDAYARFKKELGLVDFVDQESNVLSLLENNENFRQLLSRRINQIMVDEFQDTSPLQLALFLKLNECAKKGSVWVGDPKQAIYGFRGTDPELMAAVADKISDFETLEYSWRSKENLVNLSNAIFTKSFASMPQKEVALGIHDDRKADAAGGKIELWNLHSVKKEDLYTAMAEGIAELIRDKNIAPGDICVLLRNNTDCSNLARALAKWNISASAPAGQLMDSIECQLVMAAYRCCIDKNDTTALVTLAALYGENPDWINKICRNKIQQTSLEKEEQKKVDIFAELKESEWFAKLVKPENATPLEILEHVISVLGLDKKIASMSNADLRMSNLDELRNVCGKYMDQALVNRTAATPAGFVSMISSEEIKAASGFGRNTVNVMTYHKSKGLEFPVVILGSLDSDIKGGAFSIFVQQTQAFDINSPLKDRTIHYWPWPFGDKKKIDDLDNALAENPIHKYVYEKEIQECRRLFYVGLTRAKDHLIFALWSDKNNQIQSAWLNNLAEEKVVTCPIAEGKGTLYAGNSEFNITSESFDENGKITPLPSPALYGTKEVFCDFAPARKTPSSQESQGTASLLANWDHSTSNIKCGKDNFALLGSAFHDFIALNPQKNGVFYAQRLLKNYGVENAVSPEVMVTCCRNLYDWIAAEYPNAAISCEVPMTCHDENGTLYQGFIDMLLELPNGYIIIDHKTHPASHDAEQYAAGCAGQLDIYKKAVESATGKKVLKTIIHLPNLGKCYEINKA